MKQKDVLQPWTRNCQKIHWTKRILDTKNLSPKKKTLGHTRSMKGEKTKRMRRKMIILNSVGTDTPNLISTNTKIIIKRRRLEMMKRLKKSREGN